jgi:transcriptional regulator with XRE-family HTH domain
VGISENIKILRDRYHLTQDELAEIAGVTNKAVSTWETGAKEPRMGPIERIARHFGIKKSNLIEDDGMNMIDAPATLAAHFDGKEYTDEEMREILKYAQFLKSQRKED